MDLTFSKEADDEDFINGNDDSLGKTFMEGEIMKRTSSSSKVNFIKLNDEEKISRLKFMALTIKKTKAQNRSLKKKCIKLIAFIK